MYDIYIYIYIYIHYIFVPFLDSINKRNKLKFSIYNFYMLSICCMFVHIYIYIFIIIIFDKINKIL